MSAQKPRSYRRRDRIASRRRLGWPTRLERPRQPRRHAARSVSGAAAPDRGICMSDERRCLVIDEQPAVRLGVRGLLADRYEVEEADDGRDALELITSIGDFDVAIVELVPPANGARRRARSASPAIRALRRARPGARDRRPRRRAPERHAATEAIEAGATAYVAKSSPTSALARAVDAAADAETFVDPAAARAPDGGPS